MSNGVSIMISFYMFICAALLVFNVLYIYCSKGRDLLAKWRCRRWAKEIRTQCRRVEAGKRVARTHLQKMENRLDKVNMLLSYHEAVLRLCEERHELDLQKYMDGCAHTFLRLAAEYARHPAMERAFFAYLIAAYRPAYENSQHISREILRYFDDSSVFCRENALQALCSVGNAGAVIQALTILNENNWYHHPRLISDGLLRFEGDRAALAWQVWRRSSGWAEHLRVAAVQFAANVSEEFAAEFLFALRKEQTPLEVRFALVRYFQKYIYPPALPTLLELLNRECSDGGGLAISAAAALKRYPGEEVRKELMKALHSRNWYVRRNAARSLVKQGSSLDDVKILREEGDLYAAEMLQYVLESSAGTKKAGEAAV